MGDVSSALENYRIAVDLRPEWNGAASNMLLAENYVSNSQEALYAMHARWGNSLKLPARKDLRDIKNKG